MDLTPAQALEELAQGALRVSPGKAWGLFDRAWPELEERIARFVRSLRLAQEFQEDCGQNTLLRVWKGRESYRGNCLDDLYAWTYRITRNEGMRLVESASRRPSREADGRNEMSLDGFSGREPTDGEAVQQQEEARALELCIAGLDERAQGLVDLLYGDSAPSERAVASMLDISKSYVNTLRQAALAALKRCLEGKGIQA